MTNDDTGPRDLAPHRDPEFDALTEWMTSHVASAKEVLVKRGTLMIAGAVVAVAVFGGGYAIGANYGPKQEPAVTAASGNSVGAQRGSGAQGSAASGGRGASSGPVSGKVIAVNADSITIQLVARGGANGSPAPGSAIVLVGSGTRVVQTATQDSKLTELKAGDQITVVGSTDPATGVVSAQAVLVGAADLLGQLFVAERTRTADVPQRPGATPGTTQVDPAADGGHGAPGFLGIPGFGPPEGGRGGGAGGGGH